MPWKVSIHGDVEAEDRLRRLALFMADLRPFWAMLVPIVTSWWRRQFETEGGFAGHRWPSLSPSYAGWKARVYPGKPILQATSMLKQAASRPERVATPHSLTLAITDPKLQYHQDGTSRMPARPLVFSDPLPPQARVELDEVAERYVRDLLGRL